MKKSRKQILSELMQKKQRQKKKNYLRLWIMKDGKPFLENETEASLGQTINILQHRRGDKKGCFDGFDLETIATLQREKKTAENAQETAIN